MVEEVTQTNRSASMTQCEEITKNSDRRFSDRIAVTDFSMLLRIYIVDVRLKRR